MKKSRGFTLLELLVVMAIVSIIAGIGHPIYTEYLHETRRSDALIALTSAAAKQERWFTMHSQFTENMDNLGGGQSPEGFYALSVITSDKGFTLKAIATSDGGQADDLGCTEITIDHIERRQPEACW